MKPTTFKAVLAAAIITTFSSGAAHADSVPLGPAFRLNPEIEDVLSPMQGPLRVAGDSFLTSWYDYPYYFDGVWSMQAIAFDGTLAGAGTTFTLANDPGLAAWDTDGNTATGVILTSVPTGNTNQVSWQISAQLFNADGTLTGASVLVAAAPAAASKFLYFNAPDTFVARNSKGDFVVEWDDTRSLGFFNSFNGTFTGLTYGAVYARLFAADGTPLTSAITVQKGKWHFYSKSKAPDYAIANGVTINDSDSFAAAWGRDYLGTTSLTNGAQEFAANGKATGPAIVLPATSIPEYLPGPTRTALADNGNLVIAWNASNGTQTSLYTQSFSANGTALSPVVMVAADNPTGWSDLTVDGVGNYAIGVGTDSSNPAEIAYVQRYTVDGTPQGAAFSPDQDDPTTTQQGGFELKLNTAGVLMVTWAHYYGSTQNVPNPSIENLGRVYSAP